MKAQLLLITLLALAGTTLFFQQSEEQNVTESANLLALFENWKNTHSVQFSKIESDYRFSVFKENYQFIQKFNAENPETVLGLTQFAAMTNDEFKAAKTTKIMDAPQVHYESQQDFDLSAAPDNFNWVDEGKVSPVQNQGQCGSCWAFAAVSQLESLNAINSGNLQKFSEQQVTSCTPAPFSLGCNGGNPLFAYYYTASAGLQTESDYPYVQQTNGKTAPCEYNADKVVFKNQSGAAVKANSPDAMKAQLLQQPLSVAIQASGLAFQFYTYGVIKSNCGTDLDHAVSLVGYNTVGETPFWIVKNSWGASWGENGYVNIAISEGKGVCGINMSPSYPTKVQQ